MTRYPPSALAMAALGVCGPCARRIDVPIGSYLQAKLQFAFYAAAWLCFIIAAVLPAGRGPRWVGRLNLVALGLALAIAPRMYIYFKAGFHKGACCHSRLSGQRTPGSGYTDLVVRPVVAGVFLAPAVFFA